MQDGGKARGETSYTKRPLPSDRKGGKDRRKTASAREERSNQRGAKGDCYCRL